MTNYTDREYGATTGVPVEGYEFAGATTYRYTSAELGVTINGEPYTAVEISRGAVRAGTSNDDQLDIEIRLPAHLPLVMDHAFNVPPPALLLTIYRYHEGTNPASDWIIIWRGQVTGFSITGAQARLRVPSIFSIALASNVPNRNFQGMCNHVLFDARCKVNRNSFKTTTTISSITNATQFVVADDGVVDAFLRAGEAVLPSGERRMIVDNVANLITIAYPFYSVAAGSSIDLVAGCAHTFAVCNSKFSNTVNYGGFPYLPSDNPFMGSL